MKNHFRRFAVLAALFLCALGPSSQAATKAEVQKQIAAVMAAPLPEIPPKAAGLLKNTPAGKRPAMAEKLMRAAVLERKLSTKIIFGSLIKAAPETAPTLARVAAQLSIEEAAAYAGLAAETAPSLAREISEAVASVAPAQARSIQASVNQVAVQMPPEIQTRSSAAVAASAGQITIEDNVPLTISHPGGITIIGLSDQPINDSHAFPGVPPVVDTQADLLTSRGSPSAQALGTITLATHPINTTSRVNVVTGQPETEFNVNLAPVVDDLRDAETGSDTTFHTDAAGKTSRNSGTASALTGQIQISPTPINSTNRFNQGTGQFENNFNNNVAPVVDTPASTVVLPANYQRTT